MHPKIKCNLIIYTSLQLEELGNLLSQKIFLNANFGGKEEYIRDEVPAIYFDGLLGLRVILYGYGGDDGYVLEIYTRNIPGKKSQDDMSYDFKKYIAWLLSDVKEIRLDIE